MGLMEGGSQSNVPDQWHIDKMFIGYFGGACVCVCVPGGGDIREAMVLQVVLLLLQGTVFRLP